MSLFSYSIVYINSCITYIASAVWSLALLYSSDLSRLAIPFALLWVDLEGNGILYTYIVWELNASMEAEASLCLYKLPSDVGYLEIPVTLYNAWTRPICRPSGGSARIHASRVHAARPKWRHSVPFRVFLRRRLLSSRVAQRGCLSLKERRR